jgi:formylglycine-generating enzyme required for sulfatase activity
VAGEADPASVSALRLDKYHVTVGRFRQFVRAVLPADGGAGWLPPAGSGKHTHLNGGHGLNVADGGFEPGWLATDGMNVAPTDDNLNCVAEFATWTSTPGSGENLPINCVNWYEAYAFCIWDGGFLPSESEWMNAAIGGSEQRLYPWGSSDPGMDNQYAIYSSYYTLPPETGVAPVGSAPLGAGKWGQLDLVGNLWQWELDWTEGAAYVNPCVDCIELTSVPGGESRANRGDSYEAPMENLQPSQESGRDQDTPPTARVETIGFRCARAP